MNRRNFFRSSSARNERGAALITVMLIGVVLTSVVAVSTTNALSSNSQAASQTRRATALQAAEGGVADYLAKLTDDPSYSVNFVHPAESARRTTSGTTVASGSPWSGGSTWTYPIRLGVWRTLPNGYEYNLEIKGKSELSSAITIVSTGRKHNATTELRRLEVVVRPSSIADFMMITNRDISYAADVATRGKIYAGIDSGGTAHSVTHSGNAYADVLAENQVINLPASRLFNGAQLYDSDSSTLIRAVMPAPINFNTFTGSMVDVRVAAAQAQGILLDDPTIKGWRLTFRADGRVDIEKCGTPASSDMATALPACGTLVTKLMPPNGAIYADQGVIVSGVVNGQATVVTTDDVVIGRNLTYFEPGNDVLGLIAKSDIHMAAWSTNSLVVTASVIAQEGEYKGIVGAGGARTGFTHVGSVATNLGGSMSALFNNPRIYAYDVNLRFLQPPHFPTIGDDYIIQSFRELTPPAP